MHPPFGVWAHISGSDLVRDADGTMYVLEDNLRVPCGRQLPAGEPAHLQAGLRRPVRAPEHPAGRRLHRRAAQAAGLARAAARRRAARASSCSPRASTTRPTSSTASWPSGWALELVEGRDLFVADDDCVYMRTIDGPQRVDVIYRRIDDLFLDPEAFRPDSTLGVPGLLRAWRAGNVGLANAPGAGVADDKVVYAWVPDIIRYYLGEEPLIPNVPTWRCLYADERALRGRQHRRPGGEAGQRERRLRHPDRQPGHRGRARPRASRPSRPIPRNWVAQPILNLSTAPDAVRRTARAPSPRPAAVHPHRPHELRHQGRPDPRSPCARARSS